MRRHEHGSPRAGRRRYRRLNVEPLEGRRVCSASPLPAAPEVAESQLWVEGTQVAGFVITFNRPMAPGPAGNPLNYQVYGLSPFRQVPLAAAIYESALDAVILIPTHTMPVAKYSVASGAAGHPSALVGATGQEIDNQGTGYPNGVLFATFPTKGYSPGIVLQARLLAQHRAQQLHNTLNKLLNPFAGL